MRRLARIAAVLAWVVLVPYAVFAQAGLAGNVKDASGAVIPGVTVGAASPALIEKTRSVVTDAGGNYKIENLRPGIYTVTFTLPGFNTYKREGIELAGSFVATVNADLKVGAIEETITVTAGTPLVDIQSAGRQKVLSNEIVAAIPTGRSYSAIAAVLAGVNSNGNDVGAQNGGTMEILTSHGSAAGDQRVLQNGLNIFTLQAAGGNFGALIPNASGAQEVVLDTSGMAAERQTGGVAVSYILRDGGNTFKSYSFFTYGGNNLYVADNLTDRLKTGRYSSDPSNTTAPGLSAVNALIETWEINPGFGGPIRQNTLWFYYAARYQRAQDYAAGMYQNKNAFDLTKWTYVAEPSKPALSRDGWWDDSQLRLTWQATTKNKFAGTWDQQAYCQCPNAISATRAPEAASDRRFPIERLIHGEWFSPVTGRILLEFGGLHRQERWGEMQLRPADTSPEWPAPFGGSFDRYFDSSLLAVYPQMIGVTEASGVNGQAANLNYRGGPPTVWNSNWVPNYAFRGAVSFVTGTHAYKVGFNESFGYIFSTQYSTTAPYHLNFKSVTNGDGTIKAANGLPTPNQVVAFATPYSFQNDQNHDFGFYAQDKWTLKRLTLNYGVRFDYFRSSYPDQTLGAGTIFLAPSSKANLTRATARTCATDPILCGTDNLNWKDIVPRFGAAYDLRGDGKTAIKVSLNKYVAGTTGNAMSGTNPISRLTNSTSRGWKDDGTSAAGVSGITGDFSPQCDFTNPAANGECAAATGANVNFGTLTPSAVTDSALRTGWNKRGYNWEFSAGVQRQLLPRVSMEVSYFRRWFGNFTATSNTAWDGANGCGTPTDHSGCLDAFSVVAPVDDRLGNLSGQTISGFYDVKPAFAKVATNNSTLLVKDLPGSPTQMSHWNGVDVGINARLESGLLLQGGFGTGRTSTDNCEVVKILTELGGTTSNDTVYCHVDGLFLTAYKAIGIYTVPKILVQISGTFQSVPGAALQATLTLDNGLNAGGAPYYTGCAAAPNCTSGLNRPLSASPTATKTVNLLNAGVPLYDERKNQLDLRFAKIIRYGRTRTNVSLDVFNTLNQDAVLAESSAYETLWKPSSILQSRFIKLSAQFDF